MLEIPETRHIAHQLNTSIQGKVITQVVVNASSHKFAFFHKDPALYPDLLIGKIIGEATGIGAYIEIRSEALHLTFGDGADLRFYPALNLVPPKHQFFLGFDDGSALAVTIRMYGSIAVFSEGENDNPYYLASINKPSPLTDAFSEVYFMKLYKETAPALSVKAFLATGQRIPGLGNGVLQDILFNAMINPKTKLSALKPEDIKTLYASLKDTLLKMSAEGCRDTEKDLYGQKGHYQTIMSAKHLGMPCPRCQTPIMKAAYLGGAVYYCPRCQPEVKS